MPRRRPTLIDPDRSLTLTAIRTTVELLFGHRRYRPPRLLVEQWSAVSSRAGTMPAGEVCAAWLRDVAGLRSIAEAERLTQREQDPQPNTYTLVQFTVEDDPASVVLAVTFGPRAGHGGRYRVTTGPAGPVLTGLGDWVS